MNWNQIEGNWQQAERLEEEGKADRDLTRRTEKSVNFEAMVNG